MGQLRDKSSAYGFLLVAISSLGFGTLGLWAKWGYQAGFTPLPLLVLRFGIATGLLWLLVLLRYRRIPWPGSKGAITLVVQGGALYALTAGSMFQALSLLPAGLASMLFYLHPVITTLLAARLWHERTSHRQVTALVTAVLGTALLAGGAYSGNLSVPGIAFTLIAAVAYSGFTLNGQFTRHLGHPLVTCAYTTTGCFLSLVLWTRPSWQWLSNLSGRQWGIGFGVALLATVIGIMLFLAGVAIIGASQTAIVAALEPVSGVSFSLLFLGERLNASQLVGIVCILGSVLILTIGKQETEPLSTREQKAVS